MTTTRYAPRPTTYKGIKMRSRLEAQFAEWLDRERIGTWAYEPECFAGDGGQYLPDFQLHYSEVDSSYVEIKPTLDQVVEATRRMEIIHQSKPGAQLAVMVPAGSYPDVDFVTAAWWSDGMGPWLLGGERAQPGWIFSTDPRIELVGWE